MTLPLIRVRRKPRFGFPWLALLLGLSSITFALVGLNAVTAEPGSQLEVVVEGEHGLNISQATVDSVLGGPIVTWHPMRIRVTPRLLSAAELNGRSDPDADVILSTRFDDDSLSSNEERRFAGAGYYPADSNRDKYLTNKFDIQNAYTDNVGLGHGPKAVAAAAHRAVEVLDKGPLQSPLYWLAGTAIGLGLTVLALSFSLSRRKRREAIFRRLTMAQQQLASVVLELDALEVTYLATAEEHRTSGFMDTWTVVRDSSLALARTENATIEAVYGFNTALLPETTALVTKFEAAAKLLTNQADALLGAGAVLGSLAGGQGTLDLLAAPVVLGTKELLARLAITSADPKANENMALLQAALDPLLQILAAERTQPEVLESWRQAEDQLLDCILSIGRSLRRARKERIQLPPWLAEKENFTELRSGLGLPLATTHRTLGALREANSVAYILTADTSATAATVLPIPDGLRSTLSNPAPPKISKPFRGKRWLHSGLACVLMAIIIGGIYVSQIPARHSPDPTGNFPLESLLFDGDRAGLNEANIRSNVGAKFSEPLNVIVAVRRAEDYLELNPGTPGEDHYRFSGQDPKVQVDALWRVKNEFPSVLDHATGELLGNYTIIPVWTLGDRHYEIISPVTGAVAGGEYNSLGNIIWTYGSYYFDSGADYQIYNAINDLALGLQDNGYLKPEVPALELFLLLSLSISLAGITLLMIINYGGNMSAQIGLLGRNSTQVRRLRSDLESLALGLDESRINAVAVLGQGLSAKSAESDQRIFESALAMAWRMADDIAALPLAKRLDAGYVARVEKLERLVGLLNLRNDDVQRRTRLLLDAALGRKLA